MEKMSIKPHIEGNRVKRIEIGETVIPAMGEGLPIEQLADVIQALNTLVEHFDFNALISTDDQLEEWTRDEIWEFLDERNIRQILFLRLVSSSEEYERYELIERMSELLEIPEYSGKQLAGSLAGIGIRTNKLGKDALYRSDWREDSEGWSAYYSITEKYRAVISEWLDRNAS